MTKTSKHLIHISVSKLVPSCFHNLFRSKVFSVTFGGMHENSLVMNHANACLLKLTKNGWVQPVKVKKL